MSHPHNLKTEPDHDDDHSNDHSINRNSFDASENKSNNQGGQNVSNNPFLGMAAASLMDASAAKGSNVLGTGPTERILSRGVRKLKKNNVIEIFTP